MNNERGVYVTLDELLGLQERSRYMSESLSKVTKNMLQGNRPSKVNGRGGAFDQIRNYIAGDDVRNIDWNVTARMGKPFVRVFNEERETPLVILVDQSSDMFFATRKQMKSVVAAKIGAYLLWMAQNNKRPCGGVVFNDENQSVYRPRANRNYVYGVLEQLVGYNNKLSKSSHSAQRSVTLTKSLAHLNQIISKDAFVVLISDFIQLDEEGLQLIERMSLRANVIATPVCDGMISALPEEGQFLARYANLEAELDFSSYTSREKISSKSQGRIENLQTQFAEIGVPNLVFSTYLDIEQQLLSGLFIDGGGNE